MKTALAFLLILSIGPLQKIAAQNLKSGIPYTDPANERQILDIYALDGAKNLNVVFWIHGGGWQGGDKTDVQIKPRVFTERGFIFVSTNYRLLPDVEMGVLIRDVAKSLGWVHKNISRYGGNPKQIFVMGHSAGAQLAALLCTDDRYLKAEDVPFTDLKGCVPLDGDTYDVPAIIMTVELTQKLHGLPLPEYGHRAKFGNDPRKHIDFSAVTHVAKGKDIPPFLILHITENPNTTAQAKRLGAVLNGAGIPARVFGARETTHNLLNANLGLPDDPATIELFKFLDPLMDPKH
jgi:acetyl esterase/lipase